VTMGDFLVFDEEYPLFLFSVESRKLYEILGFL
jgi:hypothetical protein